MLCSTNAFQVNAGTELAKRYNDSSVLENHHACVGWTLMETPAPEGAPALVAGLTGEERKALRKRVLTAVLATDMAQHKELLASVTAKVEATHGTEGTRRLSLDGDGRARRFPSATDDDRALFVSFLLHCADLHNPLLPPPLSQRVAGELAREFAAQADAEVAQKLPVTVMLGHTELARMQLEVGFVGALQRNRRPTQLVRC